MAEEEGESVECTFIRWHYSHYFHFLKEKEKNITVKCKLCPLAKELSTVRNSTSNLKKHLDHCHANIKLIEKTPESNKRKHPDGTGENSTPGTSNMIQQTLRFSKTPKTLNPREVKRLVAEYIVEDMQPLSTVDSPAFRKLVEKIPTTNDKVSQCAAL